MPCISLCWRESRYILIILMNSHVIIVIVVQESFDALGEVLLQEQFTVWDPKQLIKKGRDRRLFLFEMCLVFSKEVKDSLGKSKYQYKFKLMVSFIEVLMVFHCCCLNRPMKLG